MVNEPKKEITAVDLDVPSLEGNPIAYYRIPEDLKDFLAKCNKEHGIVGFEYVDGSFNFGVILKVAPPAETKEDIK